MKNRIFTLLIMLFTLSLVVSCYEDEGNYDYREISTVTITGIEKSYSKISLTDHLTVDPEVKSTNPDDELEYLWVLYIKTDEDKINDIPLDTISRERKLDYLVNKKNGTYILDFYVINKSNKGVTERVASELQVITKFSKGIYIAKEVGSNSVDVDLHFEDNSMVENLLLARNGKSLDGEFKSFGYYPQFGYINPETGVIEINAFLMPVSDKEMVSMRVEDMTNIRNYEDWFIDKPATYNPIGFFPNIMTFCYVAEDGIYIDVQYPAWGMPGPGYIALPLPIDGGDIGAYQPHPSMIIGDNGFYFYDVKNKRIVSGDSHDAIKAISDDNAKYPANNIPHEFLFMGESLIGAKSTGYAIFNTQDNERIVYTLDVETGTTKNPIKSETKVPSSLKFKTATRFSTCKNGGANLIYFESGNTLYSYNNENTTEEALVFQNLESGTITYFETMYFNHKTSGYNYFAVTTENGGNYAVQLYEMVGGKPYGAPKRTLKGTGTVKSIQIVTPEKNAEIRSDYSVNY